ncbi:PoNe immunity protein domain-containing protein [Acinetobacter sp. MB5]|uniref:PoNe immunity protein domain-containing protein n=1 Tax=Acinetobacter sp. MB5 TaxID=2069438 RepID=UPI000DCFDF9D|nr:PoNe immunity protein domain-containing protein [Acinetobacter sp. MB5]
MLNFLEKRRQQFLTEEYYKDRLYYYIEGIDGWKESDAFEDDQYNCGDDRRWNLISHDYSFLLYLEYTAGKSIEDITYLFEKLIEAYEKQSEALAIFHKSEKPSVIVGEGGFIALTIISLAILLDQNILLKKIEKLINGESGGNFGEDEIINKFFKLTNSNHPNPEKDGIYSYAYAPLCDVIDNVIFKKNKNHAVELLNDYLSDWYKIHKNTNWYNSHLDLENSYEYCGYWAFEAAALVYLLDLDDRSLHKYLYYPKDIVQWIRNKKPNQITKNDSEQVRVAARESCPRSGYWFTVAQENSRQYFKQGDVFPDFESDWGDVYWQFDGDK